MSKTDTTTEPRVGYQPEPVSAPKRVRGRKAGRGAISLAVALVVVCGLAVAFLVFAVRGGHLYLALAKPVPYGAQIQASDLVTVRVNIDAGLTPIEAGDKDSVVGKYATMPLASGTLVTKAQLSGESIPGPGHQVVSIMLKTGQAPAHPLSPGTPVLVVRTPENGSNAGQPAATLSPVPGTVRAVRDLEYGAGSVIDVIVAATDGPVIATAALSGHVTLVVTAGN